MSICIIIGLILIIGGIITGNPVSIVVGVLWMVGIVYIIISDMRVNIYNQEEIKSSSVDRSKNIIDTIGGSENIDINLSKYGDNSQLIVLKNKSILIGYNNFKTKRVIDFDSIIKVEIRINNAKLGTAYQYSENKVKDIIESIIVYIHTNECTEELVFRYSSYETNEAQIKYNEILKGLKRFKVMIGDTIDTDDLDSEATLNIKEKSIPEQIKEYKELLDIGAITEPEYENKKNELLSK